MKKRMKLPILKDEEKNDTETTPGIYRRSQDKLLDVMKLFMEQYQAAPAANSTMGATI